MLKLNKKVEYALIAMLHMAEKAPGQLTTARELSETFHIPLQMTGKVLQRLAKQGLIRSVQGVKGGYQIEQSLHNISISSVVLAIEGPTYLVKCIRKTPNPVCGCDQNHACNIKSAMVTIQHKLRTFFNTISLQDLQEPVAHPPVTPQVKRN